MPIRFARTNVVVATLASACAWAWMSAPAGRAQSPAALATPATAPAASTADWPQFRGPTGQGTSAATNVPVEWGPSKNVAWKTAVPGQGWSSPVVAGGRVYLTTGTGTGGNNKDGPPRLWAVCLDAGTGKVVWESEVFRPDAGAVRAMHTKNSPASSTPIVAGDRLYAHFGHLGTAALEAATGKVVWRQTSIKYPPVHGNGGSPALAPTKDGDVLVFNCDGARDPFVVGLDAKTGDVKWRTTRNTHAKRTFSFSTPLVTEIGGTPLVISPGSGFVGAYDPATGREQWRVRYGEGYSVVPAPVYSLGLLFVSSAFDNPVVYAIKPDGATGDATAGHVAWSNKRGGPCTPSMVVVGDELYYVSDNGIATCADARTGKVHWDERLTGNFSASPVAAEGRVYFQSEQGVGYVVAAGKAFKTLAENDLGERSLASPAVTDGAIYIRTEKQLWKIGRGKSE